MARVVQRRSTNPPYLLIVFVFLFLITTAMAVLFYVQWGDASKQLDQTNVKFRKADATRSSADERTRELAQFITGKPYEDVDMAYGEAAAERADDKIYKEVGATERLGLAKLVRQQSDLLTQSQKSLAQLRGQVDTMTQQSEANNAAVNQLRSELAKAQGDFTAQVQQFTQTLQADRAKHDDLMRQARARWDEERQTLEKEKADQVQAMLARDNEAQQNELIVAKLKQQLQQHQIRPDFSVMQSDGQIVSIVEDKGICYINLTSKDGVQPGLPFEVYSKSGMPRSADTPGKASVEIRNVTDRYSECRIVRQDPTDPIMAGDLVANVAYDRNKTYKFVVAGLFDLRGTGKPSDDGTKEVKDLIRRAGGKIVDELDYDVDFLVLGDEPVAPPLAYDNPQAAAVYEQQMLAVEQYQKVKSAAANMPAFVLNGNRFLTLTGYMPDKAGK